MASDLGLLGRLVRRPELAFGDQLEVVGDAKEDVGQLRARGELAGKRRRAADARAPATVTETMDVEAELDDDDDASANAKEHDGSSSSDDDETGLVL